MGSRAQPVQRRAVIGGVHDRAVGGHTDVVRLPANGRGRDERVRRRVEHGDPRRQCAYRWGEGNAVGIRAARVGQRRELREVEEAAVGRLRQRVTPEEAVLESQRQRRDDSVRRRAQHDQGVGAGRHHVDARSVGRGHDAEGRAAIVGHRGDPRPGRDVDGDEHTWVEVADDVDHSTVGAHRDRPRPRADQRRRPRVHDGVGLGRHDGYGVPDVVDHVDAIAIGRHGHGLGQDEIVRRAQGDPRALGVGGPVDHGQHVEHGTARRPAEGVDKRLSLRRHCDNGHRQHHERDHRRSKAEHARTPPTSHPALGRVVNGC